MDRQALAAASQIKEKLLQGIPIYEIRVFGSRARGDATSESDLDLYIETDPLSSDRRRWISDVLWEIGFEHNLVVSPVIFPHPAVTKGPLSASPLYKVIQKEGIPV